MKITELEYHELISNHSFGNQRYGVRVKTTPETYEKDFVELIIEVKKRLQEIQIMNKKNEKNTC